MTLGLARKDGRTLSGRAWQIYLLPPFPPAYIGDKHPVPGGGMVRSGRFLMRENVGSTNLRRQGESLALSMGGRRSSNRKERPRPNLLPASKMCM